MRGISKVGLLGSIAGVFARNMSLAAADVMTIAATPGVRTRTIAAPGEKASLRRARRFGAEPNVTASRKGSILRKMTIERVTVRDRATGELHTVERTVPGPFVYPQTKKLVSRTLAGR